MLRKDLKDAWKDSFLLGGLLLLLFHLLQIGLEGVKEVVDDVGLRVAGVAGSSEMLEMSKIEQVMPTVP